LDTPGQTNHYNQGKRNSTHNIQAYTDGRKSEVGLGSRLAVFTGGNLKNNTEIQNNVRRTNNQAEHLAILKALEYIQKLNEENKTVLVYSDSRITLKLPKKLDTTYIHNRPNQEQGNRHGTGRMDDRIQVGQRTCQSERERASGYNGKGCI